MEEGVAGPSAIGKTLTYSAKVNMVGIAVGDPILNWASQMPTYGSTLYGMGLLMLDEKKIIDDVMATAAAAARSGPGYNCTASFNAWNSVWNDNGGGGLPGLFAKFSGSAETEDAVLGFQPFAFEDGENWLDSDDVKNAMHYNNLPQNRSFAEGGAVYAAMVESGDFCANATDLYAKLWFKADIDLMIYSSTVDPLLGPPTTEAGVQAMWRDATASGLYPSAAAHEQEFWAAPKTTWRAHANTPQDPTNVGGFARCFTNGDSKKRFCYTLIKNGGHEVPAFQPKTSYDAIWRFFDGRPYDESGRTPYLPTCDQCGGVPPFAGSALPVCNKASARAEL